MVGPSDIPCFGKIVAKISDPLFCGFNHMFCYKNRIELIGNEIDKLHIVEHNISRQISAEVHDGKAIHDSVLDWQQEVEEIQRSAQQFSEKCKNRQSWRCIQRLSIPDPIARFKLGREAVQMAKQITELTEHGKMTLADEIAWLPRVESPETDRVFHDFESRKDAFFFLWKGLVSEGRPQILGMYGMAGIGKTRMTEEICEEAMIKKIFDKIIRCDVGSELLDVIKLQNQIAKSLDCHLESQDNVNHRASQLKQSIMNAGKSLIILDNVFREIPLDIVGIPFADGTSSTGCKILLISRGHMVCLRNNCEHVVKITTLTPDESWDLFTNIIGTKKIESIQDYSLVQKLCNECGGLPLVIYAFGKALKSMPRNLWMCALSELQNGRTENITGVDPQVYACLKLAFDNLEGDAKACLLLCALFPEDDAIPMRNLIQLAKGSQLVYNGRSGVLNMVNILMSCSMLLKDEDNQHVKLPHIIRDVTRSIAVRDPKYAFTNIRWGSGSRLPDTADYGTGKLLQIDLEENDFDFPDDLLCPHLHTLWLRSRSTLEPQFRVKAWNLGWFVNLRFLVLATCVCTKQFYLRPFRKLRSLLLEHCDLFEIDGRFFPEDLETLCMWDCRLPEKLHLPGLKYLQELEIRGGASEVVFVPNSISSLSSLEELHIPKGFKILDDKVMRVPMFDNLLEFNIRMGMPRDDEHNFGALSARFIELSGGNQFECFKGLIGMAEQVKLRNTNVTFSSILDSNREAFAHLSYMDIEECYLEYIAKISHDEIQQSLQLPTSFSKLTKLYIRQCSAIKFLFCDSVAKCLLQLQQLRIYNCPLIEVIIMSEGSSGSGDIINFFSKLKSLTLCALPKLTSFYEENKGMHSSSTSVMDKKTISLFDLRSVTLKNLPNLKSFIDGANYQWHMPAVEEVQVDNCKLSNLFTSSAFQILHLKHLQVSNCGLLEHIVEYPRENETPDSKNEIITLSQLSYVVLENLPKLKIFMHSSKYECQMPALEELKVHNCGLSSLFTSNVFKNLQQLQKLKILNCALLKEIVEDARGDELFYMDKKTIILSQLKSVVLKDLEKLKSFMHNAEYVCQMPALVMVEVDNCGLSTLFTSNVFKNLQKLRELRALNCRLLEDIVVEVRDDETFYKNVLKVSRLSTVVLDNLPKLKCFSRAAKFAFDMPVLYTLCLYRCPLVENFTLKDTSTGLVSVYTDRRQLGEEVSNLNDYIRQNCNGGSHLSDTTGESSSSNTQLDKEAERVEEEQPPEERVASEQKSLRIELQTFINSHQEVTDTKTSVHHQTLLK